MHEGDGELGHKLAEPAERTALRAGACIPFRPDGPMVNAAPPPVVDRHDGGCAVSQIG